MDQTIINWLIGLLSMVFGSLLRSVWQAVKDLQTSDKELIEKVNSIKVLVVGQYVKYDEFNRFTDIIFNKLDRIEEKLNKKEDRP